MANGLLSKFCETEIGDLKALAHTDPQVLKMMVDRVSSVVPSLNSDRLAEAFSRNTGIDTEAVKAVVWTLWRLSVVQRRTECSTQSYVDSLTKCLTALPTDMWDDQDRAGWQNIQEDIIRLLSSGSPISVSAKGAELLVDQALILCSTRIITDMRPIFNDSADDVSGILTFHTLALRCHEGSSAHRNIYVALDDKDLANLREQIERAESKEKCLRQRLAGGGYTVVGANDKSGDKGDQSNAPSA